MSIDIVCMDDGAWSVISTQHIAGCEEWLSDDAPARVFAGVETLHYVFLTESQMRSALGWDLDQYCPQYEQSLVVPESITNRQAKLALLAAGMLDDAESAIAGISDAATRRAVQIEWDYAGEFRRDWPTLEKLAAIMGLTTEDVDALFIAGAALNATQIQELTK